MPYTAYDLFMELSKDPEFVSAWEELEENNGKFNEETELNETLAKLKDKQAKVVDWYHRTMEKQSLPGEYDRNNPIIDEDLIARASNKFGFGSNKLRKILRGEELWK